MEDVGSGVGEGMGIGCGYGKYVDQQIIWATWMQVFVTGGPYVSVFMGCFSFSCSSDNM